MEVQRPCGYRPSQVGLWYRVVRLFRGRIEYAKGAGSLIMDSAADEHRNFRGYHASSMSHIMSGREDHGRSQWDGAQ